MCFIARPLLFNGFTLLPVAEFNQLSPVLLGRSAPSALLEFTVLPPALPPDGSSPWERLLLRSRPRAESLMDLFLSSVSQLFGGGVICPIFQMMNPRCKEICPFFPWPQFTADLGFEPRADHHLPAMGIVLRGGGHTHG